MGKLDAPKKHPGGRPPKYRKDFHPESFIEHSKQGKTLMQIALEWDVCRDVLYNWQKQHPEFHDAVKKGREFSESWYANLGLRAMVGQVQINGQKANVNLGFFCWLTKNLFKWSDRVDMNQQTKQQYDPDELQKLREWFKSLHDDKIP